MKRRIATITALAVAGMMSLASAVPPKVVNPPGPAGGPGAGPRVKACGVERAHRPHDWKGRKGVIYHCPGI